MPVGKQDAAPGSVAKAFNETPIDFIFPVPDPFAGEAEFAPRCHRIRIAAADERERTGLRRVHF